MDKLVSLLQQFFRIALFIRSCYFVPLEFFLHPFRSFGNNSCKLKYPYIASENILGNNWSVISYNCSFALVFHDEYCVSFCHPCRYTPAFTRSCRCCFSLGCRLVAFVNQNPCTWSIGHSCYSQF